MQRDIPTRAPLRRQKKKKKKKKNRLFKEIILSGIALS
jgi:hypothetical protein